MTLLTAFNISDAAWPAYASQLVFEVYQMEDLSFSLRILYNGKVQKMPFCENKEICNINTVVSGYLKTILPESVEKNCQSSEKNT